MQRFSCVYVEKWWRIWCEYYFITNNKRTPLHKNNKTKKTQFMPRADLVGNICGHLGASVGDEIISSFDQESITYHHIFVSSISARIIGYDGSIYTTIGVAGCVRAGGLELESGQQWWARKMFPDHIFQWARKLAHKKLWSGKFSSPTTCSRTSLLNWHFLKLASWSQHPRALQVRFNFHLKRS